ncbi:DUF167 domain-containing protein [Nitrospirillum amazonense]|uniref:UPF0235 protein FBZ87_104232 n=1 Tax=Nitrospirillum amazonense TaxID=28077 RepID=A0A560JVH8_9PROT|nr:DUF167 domain-containing protein [Nitrospirillum amazonense]MDG3440533.1 DUF167 domain-containing protein [Nitrospirillum amazonense]TWB75133.1 hypothetical protein FBZ87_104232 [Nitrospirillum amazonense]
MAEGKPAAEVIPGGVRVYLRVTPRASRTAIQGLMEGPEGRQLLKVAVTTVPEDGKANEAVLKLLSKTWRVPKSSLTIVAGLTDRNKVVEVAGEAEALLAVVRASARD